MSTLICSFDGLHDNRVLRYCADFEAHTLHMDTQTEAGEKVSVRFTGLLAHWFENVIQDNILFGMDEITVDGFFQQYEDLLGGTISYGFPACCTTTESCATALTLKPTPCTWIPKPRPERKYLFALPACWPTGLRM